MQTRTPVKKKKYSAYSLELKRVLKKLPFSKHPARLLKRIIYYFIWRFRVTRRKILNPFEFDSIYWVNPNCIELCTPLEFSPFQNDGLIQHGDWDLTNKKFRDLDVFIAFKEHFIEGVQWQKTAFFSNITQEIIMKNEYHWGCQTEQEFLSRCKGIDILYQKIKQDGYQEQTQLASGFIGVNQIDEISVNLSREGKLLFNNGAHRLSIAKLLQLKTVPVRVTVTHKQCSDFSILEKQTT